MNKQRASIAFIFVTLTLDMVGIGIVIPSLPDIMRRFLADEANVSQYFGYFISLYAAMQLVASPLLGMLSDMFGRRIVLLLSLFTAGCDYILMAFAPSLRWLFAGRIISGLTGANVTVAMAYVADISTEENRAKNFGMIGAAFGLGFVIGPAMGGLLGHLGPQYPFLAASAINLLNWLYGYFVLPESLAKESRRSFSWERMNPLSSLKSVFRREHIFILAIVYFVLQMAGQTHPSIWTLYTEHRFGWEKWQVGISLTIVGLMSAISQGVFSGWLLPKWGERNTVIWGSFGGAITFALFALATQGWMMYAILCLSVFTWLAQPALQSLISRGVSSQEQGELQGSLVSLGSLAAIINPICVTQLFSIFSQKTPGHLYIPGAPYFFAATMSFLAFLVARKHAKG